MFTDLHPVVEYLTVGFVTLIPAIAGAARDGDVVDPIEVTKQSLLWPVRVATRIVMEVAARLP